VRFIGRDIIKHNTPPKLVKFGKEIFKVYLREIIKLYKEVFLILDVDYQKQKKQYDKYNKLKVDLKRALQLLQYIDKKMAKEGINRQQRRIFWRDFYRDGSVRTELFNDLIKEISGGK
jgi:methionine salvage enolase-phosphatase E1